MPFMVVLIGVSIFGLGAIFSLLAAIRTLQTSRRWSDYRLRRRYIVQARGSLLLSLFSALIAAALLAFGQAGPAAPVPAPLPASTTTGVSEATPTAPPASPTSSPLPAESSPTFIVITPSPQNPPTSALTPTPAMPIAVQAVLRGTTTPVFEVQFGRIRFSTEIANYRLIAPGEDFHNPIKHMYAVFTYLPIGAQVEWTALWYQNGELKHVDTTSWSDSPAGIGVADWARDPAEWQAGEYEIQIFLGAGWKVSGRFSLTGEPPTVTATVSPTVTASFTATASASRTPTKTIVPTASRTATSTSTPSQTVTPLPTASPRPSTTPAPQPTATLSPAPTRTAAPTATAAPTVTRTSPPSLAGPTATTRTSTATPMPSSTATHTSRPTATRTVAPTKTQTALPSPTGTSAPTTSPTPFPTATQRPSATPTKVVPSATATPSATASKTARPTPTLTPSITPTKIPTATATQTASPTVTPTLPPVTIRIYFTSNRMSGNQIPPFNQPVMRAIPGSANPIAASLEQYFKGPTVGEQAAGLMGVLNGFVSYRRLDFSGGVLTVYLAGNCQTGGTPYSIAQPLIATLRQFAGVQSVKIYDEYDHTRDALSATDSWPACLDVLFTSTFTPTPTHTFTTTPSLTPSLTPSATATRTLLPTATKTASPTSTSIPTELPTHTSTPRPTPLPTSTFTATARPTPTATRTPIPTATLTASATITMVRTPRPLPTSTPSPTPLPTFSSTPTARPTSTTTPSPMPTRTPVPSATAMPSNTFTASPPATATSIPTRVPSTATASLSPTLMSTSTAVPAPTQTSTPVRAPTGTPRPSATALLTNTAAPTIDSKCDRVEFLGDVTIVDNATLHVGESFTKTWRIRNAGSCAWTAAYRLVFVRGDRMGGADWLALPGDVAPNQTIDVSVQLTAPASPGEYQGYWQLQTPDGRMFGIGPSAAGNLWVKIRTIAPALAAATSSPAGPATIPALTAGLGAQPTGTAAAPSVAASATAALLLRPTSTPSLMTDLVGSACNAQWQGNDGTRTCPGQEGDAGGYVLPLTLGQLEGGTTVSLPTLLTVPSSSKDGYVLGLYPQYLVESGDHFQATVGCEANSLACSVLFRLSYLDSSGAPHDLWSLGEFYDGKYFVLDVDLSALAGQQVRLVLSVNSLGSATGDRALWVGPRVAHFDASATAVSMPPTAAVARVSATPGPTSTASATPRVVVLPTATPSPTPKGSAPSIPQILQSIVSFFTQLFSGR